MKKTFKAAVFSAIIFSSLFTLSCRPKPAEISFSCQRLASCFANYGKDLKDNNVLNAIQSAQIEKDETKCLSAIQQLSSAVNQECPF